MLKTYQVLILVSGLLLLTSTCARSQSERQPNIIYILADDLGYSELGSYGNTFNETPNLDQLASDGVRFTQAYAAAPVCSPYRAALMTGQYPARVGITDYLRPDAADHLDTAYTTLAEALQNNGYHTGIIGKWHLSGYASRNALEETLPDQHGFDEVITSETTGIANGTYFHPYHFNPDLKKKLPGEHEFLVDRMNAEAVEFIERNQDQPFFLYLSHYAVHTMLHGQPEEVDHFREKPDSGSSPPSENNPDNDPYKKWPADYFAKKNNPHLAAQLKVIDEGVGMVRDKLQELGIAENTVIIFTSDNGGESRVTDNAPLRAGKSTLYEGGIREPLIIYQPEKITGGRVVDVPTANYDFYPTLCELTNTSLPEDQVIDGISIAPYLLEDEEEPSATRTFYWHYPLEERHFLGGRSAGAIRDGDWKLIEFFDTGEKALYNLKNDPGETHDLHASFPEQVEELQQKLVDWRHQVIQKQSD
ncbi:MAG: sulfatase [Cyclobacteriaceae bacterium]|jgi:arylsulfatase A